MDSLGDLDEEEMLALAIAASLSSNDFVPSEEDPAAVEDSSEWDPVVTAPVAIPPPVWPAIGRSPSNTPPARTGVAAAWSDPAHRRVEPDSEIASLRVEASAPAPASSEAERPNSVKGTAHMVGFGAHGCDNDDDAIVGAALKDIPAQRVVQFKLSFSRSESTVEERKEEEGKGIVHGYDAVALARWLAREKRLPLTSHAVSDSDFERVWDALWATATEEELTHLQECKEIFRDEGGMLRRSEQVETEHVPLREATEAELECLDWPFFLAEIERLQAQISAVRNNFLRDRSFAKARDGHLRMQLLAELEVRLTARRRQFQHIDAPFDASEVMADLYQMQELLDSVQSGAPVTHLQGSFAHSVQGPNRYSAADAEWDDNGSSEEDYDYDEDYGTVPQNRKGGSAGGHGRGPNSQKKSVTAGARR